MGALFNIIYSRFIPLTFPSCEHLKTLSDTKTHGSTQEAAEKSDFQKTPLVIKFVLFSTNSILLTFLFWSINIVFSQPKMTCRNVIENVNLFVIAPIGILLNLVALYVIKKCAAREMDSYRVVLIVTCSLDLFISVYVLLMGTVGFFLKLDGKCFI
jgi:hypothetical protein